MITIWLTPERTEGRPPMPLTKLERIVLNAADREARLAQLESEKAALLATVKELQQVVRDLSRGRNQSRPPMPTRRFSILPVVRDLYLH